MPPPPRAVRRSPAHFSLTDGSLPPQLVTRTDLSVFLPPIGGCTAYIFGDPATIPDESKPLTVRGTRLGPRLTR